MRGERIRTMIGSLFVTLMLLSGGAEAGARLYSAHQKRTHAHHGKPAVAWVVRR